MRNKPIYPPPKVIAVDVDGTLVTDGIVNSRLVEWCKHQKSHGFYMILWSSRGQAHAEKAATLAKLSDVFDIMVSKPGYIVDDQGWGWVRFTHIIKNFGL